MSVRLGVNIDHVATLRQVRRATEPDPVAAATLCEQAGADGIVCHLREDRRHIQDNDLILLRQTVKTKLNLEMACTEEMIGIAAEVKPDQVTLVPERREEITTEGGLDVAGQVEKIADAVKRLKAAGLHVSLFIDPEEEQIAASKQVGADAVELHTGNYANAKGLSAIDAELAKLRDAARAAYDAGLKVYAGHGLNYRNVVPVARIREVEELNIGHSIIARAVLVGIEKAVREMIELIREAR